jgi:hypothetical protein
MPCPYLLRPQKLPPGLPGREDHAIELSWKGRQPAASTDISIIAKSGRWDCKVGSGNRRPDAIEGDDKRINNRAKDDRG